MEPKELIRAILKWLWLAIRIALVAGAALVALLFALVVIPGGRNHLPLSWQKVLADNNIDNSYVQTEFDRWQEVAPEGFAPFRIPEHWEFSVRSGTYRLLNGNTTTAYGTSFGLELDPYPTTEAFFSSFVPFEITSIHQTQVTDFYDVGNCDLTVVTVRGDDDAMLQFHYLTLCRDNGPQLVLAFPHGNLTQAKIQEIAQAMAYDYIF